MILIGADPELFLMKGNKFHSGHGMIPGTKLEPHKVPLGAVQVDGMALEFNIEPARDWAEFSQNINTVLATLRSMIPDEFDLAVTPTADFERAHMAAQPPEAKLLGCDPDFNAYTGEMNPAPEPPPYMRTAAGHVHVGWTKDADPFSEEHMMMCRGVAMNLDYMLGVPSVIMDPDVRRRTLYGKAGAFRPKPYGMEYRVLSNFWLKDEQLMQLVYNNTIGATLNAFDKPPMFYNVEYERHRKRKDAAREAINNNDQNLAIHICRTFGIPYAR